MVLVKKQKSFKKAAREERKERQIEAGLSIPTEPFEPATTFPEFCTVIFGDKGIGKTSLLAEYPKCLVFQLEPGRRHLRIRQVPKPGEDALDWPTLQKYLKLAIADSSVQTVGIDTVDRAYELCFRHKCGEQGVDHPQKLGRDGQFLWNSISSEFSETFNEVRFSQKTLVFISHGKFHTIENVLEGRSIDKYCPSCTGQALSYLQTACDFAFCYTYRGLDRVMVLRGNEAIWASCGPPNTFMSAKTGKPLSEITMGSSGSEAYRILCDGFDNKLVGRVVSSAHDATDESPDGKEKPKKKKFKVKK